MAAVLVLGYSWWAVSLPPFSAAATAAVLLAGVAASAWGGAKRRSERQPAGEVDVRAWVVLAMAASAWELWAYLQSPRAHHPTLSSLTNELLDSHPARAAACVLWLAASAELARR